MARDVRNRNSAGIVVYILYKSEARVGCVSSMTMLCLRGYWNRHAVLFDTKIVTCNATYCSAARVQCGRERREVYYRSPLYLIVRSLKAFL